jgi:hypothetical protein
MLGDVRGDLHEGELLIEHDIGCEMEASVPEGSEADQPAHPDDLVPAGQPSEWRDGQREHNAAQRGVAGDVLHELHLVAHDTAGEKGEQEPGQRQESAEVQRGLDHPRYERGAGHKERLKSFYGGPCPRRARRPGRHSR